MTGWPRRSATATAYTRPLWPVSVRARAAGRDLLGLDTGIGQDGVKRRGELPGPITDQEPEAGDAITQIH